MDECPERGYVNLLPEGIEVFGRAVASGRRRGSLWKSRVGKGKKRDGRLDERDEMDYLQSPH